MMPNSIAITSGVTIAASTAADPRSPDLRWRAPPLAP